MQNVKVKTNAYVLFSRWWNAEKYIRAISVAFDIGSMPECQSHVFVYLYLRIYVYLKYIGAILTAFDSGAMPKWWDLV